MQLQSAAVVWKDVVKLNGLHDSGIAEDLKVLGLERVHVAIRHSQRSGLIVANFVIRSVAQNADSIHAAKMDIERAVDRVKAKLPTECVMKMHLCSVPNCKELVIRDTEGYCSRHRAQKYHKRNAQKRNLLQLEQRRKKLEHGTATTINTMTATTSTATDTASLQAQSASMLSEQQRLLRDTLCAHNGPLHLWKCSSHDEARKDGWNVQLK